MTDHNTSPRLDLLRAETRDALRDAIDVRLPVALLDIPTYMNVGDQLIYQGERRYLRGLGVRIAYKADRAHLDAGLLRETMPAGTILITGGGNFGDIWLPHQRFREQVATEFPDYRIVQLPQSVYFRNAPAAAGANRLFGTHPDFLLMVRESASLQRARTLLPDVKTLLVPDMALGCELAGGAEGRGRKPPRTLIQARGDQESVSGLAALAASHASDRDIVSDWSMSHWELREYAMGLRLIRFHWRRPFRAWRRATYPLASLGYELVRHANVRGGVRLFEAADIVLTDRLHGMVLATLLGIPNVAMDNEYGKVSAIFHEYVQALGVSTLAEDEAQLMAEWERLRHVVP